jgi:dihydroorotate dehydrogenase electron transfer subunit
VKWLEEQRDPNHPHICTIERIVDETPTVRTLYFHDPVLADVKPGQFAMVWIPGVNELPMSVMVSDVGGQAALTVRKRGESSTALYNLSVGQQIGVRGPYGNSFEIKDGKILLIGGGTGLVPLMRLIKFSNPSNHITVLMGSQTKDEVFFEETAKEMLKTNFNRDIHLNSEIIPVTEDGSYGEKGYVTDILEKLLEENTYDAIYTCGPELMMYKTVQMANKKGIFVQASLERMMKCGVGICGSCCVNDILACRDGTIFDGDDLSRKSEFGHSHRTKSGILEEI